MGPGMPPKNGPGTGSPVGILRNDAKGRGTYTSSGGGGVFGGGGSGGTAGPRRGNGDTGGGGGVGTHVGPAGTGGPGGELACFGIFFVVTHLGLSSASLLGDFGPFGGVFGTAEPEAGGGGGAEGSGPGGGLGGPSPTAATAFPGFSITPHPLHLQCKDSKDDTILLPSIAIAETSCLVRVQTVRCNDMKPYAYVTCHDSRAACHTCQSHGHMGGSD